MTHGSETKPKPCTFWKFILKTEVSECVECAIKEWEIHKLQHHIGNVECAMCESTKQSWKHGYASCPAFKVFMSKHNRLDKAKIHWTEHSSLSWFIELVEEKEHQNIQIAGAESTNISYQLGKKKN